MKQKKELMEKINFDLKCDKAGALFLGLMASVMFIVILILKDIYVSIIFGIVITGFIVFFNSILLTNRDKQILEEVRKINGGKNNEKD